MEDEFEERYCSKCDADVQAWVTCSSGVGQYGAIVVAKSFCTVCQHKVFERLVDTDI